MEQQLRFVSHPETKLQAEVLPSDVRKVIVGEDEQQEWSSRVEQEQPEPPHIKEEQEELWTSQEGEQLQGLEEADISKLPFPPVPVKSEDDEEKPQSSQLHQSPAEESREVEPLSSSSTHHLKTEADGDHCGGPEPASNLDPDTLLHPDTEGEMSDSPEPETDDSMDWKEAGELLKNGDNAKGDVRCRTGKKQFSCSECGKRFGCKRNLKRHIQTHTGEKTFFCSDCNTSFTRRHTLLMHMRTHTGEKPFTCSVCGTRFARKENMKTHIQGHTGEKPFSCLVCHTSFTRRHTLTLHMRTHTGEKPFNCLVCGKRFNQNSNLKNHMVFHTGEKLHSCSVCDKRFAWRYQLKNHKCVGETIQLQLHQSPTEENREVEPLTSSSTQHMNTEADGDHCGGPEPASNLDPDRHLHPDTDDQATDSPETDDSVDWKKKREVLKSDGDSKGDMRCQTGKKQFCCTECGKRFGCKENLKRHIRIHTGEKPFNCSVCSKSFNQKSSLQLHTRIHTGEKPFSCLVCNTSFTLRQRLVEHMRTHTGVKPFICSVCGKTFSLKENMTRHMRTHTGEKPLSCSICDKRFTWKSQLTRHKCAGENINSK